MKLVSMAIICLSVAFIVAFTGCQKSNSKLSQPVRWTGESVDQVLTDGVTTYKIVTANKFNNSISKLTSTNLILGFPKKSLGEQHVFGGLITEISDPSEDLGSLKMSQLAGFNVVVLIN